jgi:hypothetical protein
VTSAVAAEELESGIAARYAVEGACPELHLVHGQLQSTVRIQTMTKSRYLLLLDIRGINDIDSLKTGYEKHLPPGNGGAAAIANPRTFPWN